MSYPNGFKPSSSVANTHKYLRAHLSGALNALEVLAAVRDLWEERAPELERLRAEVEWDRARLTELMDSVGVRKVSLTTVAASGTAMLVRLHLEVAGHLRDDVSLLEALEAIVLGIRGKLLLWETLSDLEPSDCSTFIADHDLIERAKTQLHVATELRSDFAQKALDLPSHLA